MLELLFVILVCVGFLCMVLSVSPGTQPKWPYWGFMAWLLWFIASLFWAAMTLGLHGVVVGVR